MSENTHTLLIRCGIVDDEPLAREGLCKFVQDIPYLQICFVARDPIEASQRLQAEKIDLLFLDIEMPKMSGLEWLRTLNHKPVTILTTAYPEYALEGYELDILDYLLKPISFQRFMKAVTKASHYFERSSPVTAYTVERPVNHYFFIKSSRMIEKVEFADILYIEALLNYVAVITKQKKIVTYSSLNAMLEQLPKGRFLKVHKSFIVNLRCIQKYAEGDLFIEGVRIPVSHSHRDELKQALISPSP